MKFPYSWAYFPTAPVVEIRLRSDTTDRILGPFQALIDTGSDASLVPKSYLLAIDAPETAPAWMVGITGKRIAVALYHVDIYLGETVFPGVPVIGDEHGDEVILGRDVLNRLALFLDGPRQQTVLPDDAVVQRWRG